MFTQSFSTHGLGEPLSGPPFDGFSAAFDSQMASHFGDSQPASSAGFDELGIPDLWDWALPNLDNDTTPGAGLRAEGFLNWGRSSSPRGGGSYDPS